MILKYNTIQDSPINHNKINMSNNCFSKNGLKINHNNNITTKTEQMTRIKLSTFTKNEKTPSIKIKILFNFTDTNGKIWKKKPFLIPSYNSKTDKYYNCFEKINPELYKKGFSWMKWSFEECELHNKYLTEKERGLNAVNINITNSKCMIIDIDDENKKDEYLEEYGNIMTTKSTGRGLPHLWRLKHKDDKNTTKTNYKEGLDLIYTNVFEFEDTYIENYTEDIPEFDKFPDVVVKKKRVFKVKTPSNDSGLGQEQQEEVSAVLGVENAELKQYLDLIPSDDYDTFIKVVFACKNDSDGNYKICNEWCKKSEKYEESFFNETWNNAKEGNTIGTIKYLANKCNPAEYKLLYMKKSISITDDKLALCYLNIQSNNIVYSNEEIYLYKKNWIKDNKKTLQLKKDIRVHLQDFFLRLEITINNEILNMDDEDEKALLQKKKESISKIIEKCSTKKSIDNIADLVIQDLASLNRNVVFDLGEEQKYNLHFKNGVYEIKTKKFRKRTQEDYITKFLDWNYNDKVNQSIVKELDDFYTKLQPDKEQKRFSLEWLAYNLTGSTGKQKFKMNIGYSAGNGKSTEFKIHDSIFDIYSFKLDSKTFNMNNDKKHKQLIHLINNPVRFAYCEELQQTKLDVDFIKDIVDGSKLNCEIMYSTSTSKSIQAKLNFCSNKDFNVDIDKGILRRGLVQFYESKFRAEYTEDNTENHTYKLIEEYEKRFLQEDYKNAYLQLLLNNYQDDFQPPKKNKDAFKDIANEYDENGSILEECFIMTDDKKDLIYKNDLFIYFKDRLNKKSMSWRTFLSIMKNKDIKYDKNKMFAGQRGQFVGIKFKETKTPELDLTGELD